jgi:hypothetical protein
MIDNFDFSAIEKLKRRRQFGTRLRLAKLRIRTRLFFRFHHPCDVEAGEPVLAGQQADLPFTECPFSAGSEPCVVARTGPNQALGQREVNKAQPD